MRKRILVTGGAGYIGSALVAALLHRGDQVTVIDDLWFGGEQLLPYLGFGSFRLLKRDICANDALLNVLDDVDCVVHLAAIVGFPACDKAGRDYVWRLNVETTERVYRAAALAGVNRLIFASSYSNYGESSHERVSE